MTKERSNFLKSCGTCGADVHHNARACPNCGAPNPWKLKPPSPVADEYIVTENFSTTIGIQLRTFKSGETITDQSVIARLVADEAPVRPRDRSDKITTCPHCHETYLLEDKPPAQYSPEVREKLIRLGHLPPDA